MELSNSFVAALAEAPPSAGKSKGSPPPFAACQCDHQPEPNRTKLGCMQGVPCPAPGSPPRPKFHRVSWPAEIFPTLTNMWRIAEAMTCHKLPYLSLTHTNSAVLWQREGRDADFSARRVNCVSVKQGLKQPAQLRLHSAPLELQLF